MWTLTVNGEAIGQYKSYDRAWGEQLKWAEKQKQEYSDEYGTITLKDGTKCEIVKRVNQTPTRT